MILLQRTLLLEIYVFGVVPSAGSTLDKRSSRHLVLLVLYFICFHSLTTAATSSDKTLLVRSPM